MGIREEFPLLSRHEGAFEGTYTYVNRDCEIVDQHTAILTHEFPTEGEADYFQVNHYFWPDGREERIEFPGTWKDGRLWFHTERIDGSCWATDDATIVLHWHYVSDPTVELYELINLDESGNNRTRTWHWLKDGVCYQRTLINETRKS